MIREHKTVSAQPSKYSSFRSVGQHVLSKTLICGGQSNHNSGTRAPTSCCTPLLKLGVQDRLGQVEVTISLGSIPGFREAIVAERVIQEACVCAMEGN